MRTGIAVCISLAMLTAVAVAEDINPPTWRGEPNTSWVQYEFLTDIQPPVIDDGYLPFGDPVIEVIPGPGAGWSAQQPTYEMGGPGVYDPAGDPGDGWWNLSGEIIITLQNDPTPRPHKEIWLQFVWEPQAPGNAPILQITDPYQEETTIPFVRTVLWEEDPVVNEWRKVYHDTWHFDLFPNPPFETISIRGGINVDELVIDTWCVPEPATMALLGLGGAAALLRRRRA